MREARLIANVFNIRAVGILQEYRVETFDRADILSRDREAISRASRLALVKILSPRRAE